MTGSGPLGRPPDPDPAAPPEPRAPEGPPGNAIFTLEGRQAPGLYLAAWVISAVGLGLFLIGALASSRDAATVLLALGTALLTFGLATACGYQALERRAREPDRYRGPAPLLVFGVYFFAMALVGFLVTVAGLLDAGDPFGFLVIGSLQAVAYAVVVWLMVVRTGSLTWRQMGWATPGGPGPGVLRAVGVAIAVMLPLTLALLVLGGILGTLLGVDAPDVLPAAESSSDALAVALTAGLIIPIGEELFFRGFVLTAWLRDLGERTALIRSSLFFALVHVVNISTDTFAEGAAQALLQTAVILPVGFAFGWLFLRHGMAAAIAAHVTYNSLLLFLAYLATTLPPPT
ncbi:MAG: type II CAAX endopeptidase family protein [Candidatus Limnocylindrales bacterium]